MAVYCHIRVSELAMTNRYLNIVEAAAYLRMSRWYLYKMVERRRVPYIPMPFCGDEPLISMKRSKKAVRFDALALDKWMMEKVITPLDRRRPF